MPKTTSVSGPVGDGASRARHAGQAAFDRLTQSVEAAQVALKDLRKELSKGSRDVLADLETTLKDARKDLRSVRRPRRYARRTPAIGSPSPRQPRGAVADLGPRPLTDQRVGAGVRGRSIVGARVGRARERAGAAH